MTATQLISCCVSGGTSQRRKPSFDGVQEPGRLPVRSGSMPAGRYIRRLVKSSGNTGAARLPEVGPGTIVRFNGTGISIHQISFGSGTWDDASLARSVYHCRHQAHAPDRGRSPLDNCNRRTGPRQRFVPPRSPRRSEPPSPSPAKICAKAFETRRATNALKPLLLALMPESPLWRSLQESRKPRPRLSRNARLRRQSLRRPPADRP